MGAGKIKPAGEITSRRPKPVYQGSEDADQTSDLTNLHLFNRCVLFCAMNAGSTKTPLVLRGGTSFALAVSSNCIEDNLSRILGILTLPDFTPQTKNVKRNSKFHF